ncbi:hypothetical protein [Paenibacillus sp. HB172176]|uniref:hypothetical protein n=1 Tax=Paenibacillus sp. HB172176 TaxID=2493690 RepID=UPI00143C578D|nr:hypothetical protein [Paenibacillus sp. HB172176]
MDLAGAYPEEAGVEKWERTIRLRRKDKAEITVTDEYTLEEPSRSIHLNFMTAQGFDLKTPGRIVFEGGEGTDVILAYDEQMFEAEVQTIELTDPKIQKDWERECLYRLQLRTVSASRSNKLSVRISKTPRLPL